MGKYLFTYGIYTISAVKSFIVFAKTNKQRWTVNVHNVALELAMFIYYIYDLLESSRSLYLFLTKYLETHDAKL